MSKVQRPNFRCIGRAEPVVFAFLRHWRRATEHFLGLRRGMFFTLALSPYKDALKLALAQQITILILSAGVLDSGDLFSICLIPFIAFWVGVSFIRRRRPEAPTKLDVIVIKWTYIPLCIVTFLLVNWFWKLRGLL
jgi:hypothetical protein